MAEFHHFLAEYGYVALVGLIALESMGIPLPGETVLVMASIHAGTRGGNIGLVIAAATLGAILGDNIGYVLGRELGFRFLVRFGSYLRLSDARIKLGQSLFMKHGAKVVFFGRFSDFALPRRVPRRCQSDGVAALSLRQWCRCGRVGDHHRFRRLHVWEGLPPNRWSGVACILPARSGRGVLGVHLPQAPRNGTGSGS